MTHFWEPGAANRQRISSALTQMTASILLFDAVLKEARAAVAPMPPGGSPSGNARVILEEFIHSTASARIELKDAKDDLAQAMKYYDEALKNTTEG